MSIGGPSNANHTVVSTPLNAPTTTTHAPGTSTPATARRTLANTQKQETLDALARSRNRLPEVSSRDRLRGLPPGQRSLPSVVPVHVREESADGDGIIVTLREGHWVEKPKPSEPRVQLGLHTGKPVSQYLSDLQASVEQVVIDGQALGINDPPSRLSAALATQLRRLHHVAPGGATPVTDPRTPEGAAWLQGEFEKVRDRVTDPASKPRQEVIDWIVNDAFPPKAERSGQDTYWEHIFLRYCGGDHLPMDLERNYSKELRWAYIGEWNASGKGHPAIHTSATLLNDKLAGTGYDVFETKFMQVGDRLCVTELWGYRDDKIKNNQVTDGVDTFWIENGEITHKMISLTVTDADGNPRDYYRKIGQPFPPDAEFERLNPVE